MRFIKYLLLSFAVMFIMTASGCGEKETPVIKADTTFKLDKEFSGVRVINAEISWSDYRNAIGKEKSILDSVIEENLPEGISCSTYKQTDGSILITETISFSSEADYNDKISALYSLIPESERRVEPEAVLSYDSSLLKKGYAYRENFTSSELLSWICYALNDSEETPDEELTNLFTDGSVTAYFEGEQVSVKGSTVVFSTIDSDTFTNISIYTYVAGNGSISAKVSFTVPNSMVGRLGTRLTSIMNSFVPSEAVITYTNGGSSRIYTISFNSSSTDDYVLKMDKILCTNNNSLTVTTSANELSFTGSNNITAFFDGSHFLDYADSDTELDVTLCVDSSYSLNSCTGKYGYVSSCSSSYNSEGLNISISLHGPEEVSVELGFAVEIQSVSINTIINKQNDIEREIVFTLTSDAYELIGTGIEEKLKDSAQYWVNTGKVTISANEKVDSTEYRIYMSASSGDELSEMTRAVLGESSYDNGSSGVTGHSSFNEVEQTHSSPFRIYYKTNDVLNLSSFLGGSFVTGGVHYQLTYPEFFIASFTENMIFEDGSASGRSVSGSTYNKIISVTSEAYRYNMVGIVLVIITLASLMSSAVIIALNFSQFVYFMLHGSFETDGKEVFTKKNIRTITLLCVSLVCLAICLIRLIFHIY
ncbi:MAG: hypothetical protein K5637_06510 [Lachnospiraceae bacterium]|nr:hypothetical protein [Lachnospiraceae bacterium]